MWCDTGNPDVVQQYKKEEEGLRWRWPQGRDQLVAKKVLADLVRSQEKRVRDAARRAEREAAQAAATQQQLLEAEAARHHLPLSVLPPHTVAVGRGAARGGGGRGRGRGRAARGSGGHAILDAAASSLGAAEFAALRQALGDRTAPESSAAGSGGGGGGGMSSGRNSKAAGKRPLGNGSGGLRSTVRGSQWEQVMPKKGRQNRRWDRGKGWRHEVDEELAGELLDVAGDEDGDDGYSGGGAADQQRIETVLEAYLREDTAIDGGGSGFVGGGGMRRRQHATAVPPAEESDSDLEREEHFTLADDDDDDGGGSGEKDSEISALRHNIMSELGGGGGSSGTASATHPADVAGAGSSAEDDADDGAAAGGSRAADGGSSRAGRARASQPPSLPLPAQPTVEQVAAASQLYGRAGRLPSLRDPHPPDVASAFWGAGGGWQ